MGVASLWCAVILMMVAMAAPAASDPCPAGQVPVTRGGICVPVSPLIPGPTPSTAVPTTPAPTPTVAPVPAPGGTVPGQPGTSAPAPSAQPLTPGDELPEGSDRGNELPGTNAGDAGATVNGTTTPSSASAPTPSSPVPATSAAASSGVPDTGTPGRQNTQAGSTPGVSPLAAAGYLLALGGILLLAWSAASFALHRP